MLSRRIFAPFLAVALLTPGIFVFSQKSPFVSFEVQPGAGCSVLIQWEISAEMDTLKYEAEKSKDKENWETIAHRSLRSSHQYLIIDAAPNDSLNYYRIKLVDNQNRFTYSEIEWVQVNTVSDVFIWPNPARNLLYIKTPFLSGGIDITDANGRLARKIVITDFITELPIESLAKGIYFLSIRTGNRLLIEKFIKV